MRRFILTISLLFLPLLVNAAQPVSLVSMNVQPSQTTTRFTFTLTQKTYGRVKFLTTPNRVIVEFAHTTKHFTMQHARLGGANVLSIDSEETAAGNLRFIFYVGGKVTWTIRFLPDDAKGRVRLEITIESPKVAPKPAASPTSVRKLPVVPGFVKVNNIAVAPLKKSFESDILNTLSDISAEIHKKEAQEEGWVGRSRLQAEPVTETTKKPAIFTVVIDAGHGGKDPGAKGKRGSQEKNIVLAIAKKLAREINQTPAMRAVLTRNGDYFIPLSERLKLARKGKADVFIAIHADAYFEENATGASVYILSPHGASSVAARWLAQRDNHSELGGVEFDALQDQSPLLRSVLIDLAQTATARDSIQFGNTVLDALDEVSTLHYTHVERAPFLVLKSPDIPSILVETGFISNPREEKRLADATYQEKVAHALFSGIHQYVQKYGAARF